MIGPKRINMNNVYNTNVMNGISRYDSKVNEERYKVAQWPEIRYHLNCLICNMLAPPNEIDDCFTNHKNTLRLARELKAFSPTVEREIWVAQTNIAMEGYTRRFFRDTMGLLIQGLEDLHRKLDQLSEPVFNPRKKPNLFIPNQLPTKSQSRRRRLAAYVLPHRDLRTGIEGGGKHELEFLLRLYQATVLWIKFAHAECFTIFDGMELKQSHFEGSFKDHLYDLYWRIVLEPFSQSLLRMYRTIVLPEKWGLSKIVILKLKHVTDSIYNLFEAKPGPITTPIIRIDDAISQCLVKH